MNKSVFCIKVNIILSITLYQNDSDPYTVERYSILVIKYGGDTKSNQTGFTKQKYMRLRGRHWKQPQSVVLNLSQL